MNTINGINLKMMLTLIGETQNLHFLPQDLDNNLPILVVMF